MVKSKRHKIHLIVGLAIASLTMALSCQTYKDNNKADLIISGGDFYTATGSREPIEALAIKEGFISNIGSIEDVMKDQGLSTKMINAENLFVMPGFIEGHGHFSALGQSLDELNFLDSKNWEEIVAKVVTKAKEVKDGEWIIGRGWHQDKWNVIPSESINQYPIHRALSKLIPYNPVMLTHASGHALFANAYAMKIAGVSKEMNDPLGGRIVRDANGQLAGVFEENAMSMIKERYANDQNEKDSKDNYNRWLKHVKMAETECLKNGITSFQDAGSDFTEIENYKKLAQAGNLNIRLWVMIRSTLARLNEHDEYPFTSPFLTCRAVKAYVDGALGSYGAWLLNAYYDKPDFFGQNITSLDEIEALANFCGNRGLQLCVHAIGDRANREILDIYEKQAGLSILRWRIEHAQHLDEKDITRFGELGIIASMQGVHCTSDAPFVEKRLGKERAATGAYAWRSLLDSNARLANGSDAPVEKVSVLDGIYASTTRRNKDGGHPFYVQQAMSRDEALKSFTIWNAYAAHEEDIKGSLEKSKLADIVILDKNLLLCNNADLLQANVLMTIVNGTIKYQNASFSLTK